MSGAVVLVPLLLLALVAGVVGLVLVLTAQRSSSLAPTVAAARRHGVGVGLLAVVAAGVAAGATARSAPVDALTASGVPAVLAVVVFGLVHTAVVVAGELTWPRPRGGVRTAALTTRSWRDSAPRALSALCAAGAASATTAALVGWSTAAPDGRSVALRWTDAAGAVGSATSSPYPGRVFAAPVLVGVVLVVLAVLLTTRVVVARSAVALAGPADEGALRRASAHRALRGATAALTVLAAGTWTAVGAGAVGVARTVELNDPLQGTGATTAVGVALVVLGLVHGALAVAVLCWPAPRVGARVPAPGSTALLAPGAA